jgi:hypothetical protein
MSETNITSFDRFGRSFHLKIRSADDFERVLELDETHWVATSAPVHSLNFDKVFIRLLDKDDSGRILCGEVHRAIRWTLDVLKVRDGVSAADQELQLAAINPEHPDGARILSAVTNILRQLGDADSSVISLDQVRQVKTRLEAQPVSESGVTLPQATCDEDTRQFVADIVTCLGGVDHPSGARGVNQPQLETFIEQATAFLDWHAKGATGSGKKNSEITPLGDKTADAYATISSLSAKIDQYFSQCRAIKFDQRTADHFLVSEKELQEMDLADPAAIEKMMRAAPLSMPTEQCQLMPADAINIAYADQVHALFEKAVRPVFGKETKTLTEEQWRELQTRFEPHRAWVESKPAAAVETLGMDKLEAYLAPRFRKALESLIAASDETAVVMDTIRLTEKLILFQANLLTLLNNFVSFPHLYHPHKRAMFEMGTLIMDGRRLTFSVKVHDRKHHSELAKTSNIFVIYAEVDAKEDATGFEIAVPVTAGGKGNLCVGKRGVFEDIRGRHFDAKIIQIIDNPISLREAVLSPYQRFGRLISGKIESITASSEKRFDEQAQRAMDQAPKTPSAALPTGGMLMGGGVAIAALSSAAAYVTRTIATVDKSNLMLTILFAALAVILPTALIAVLKLRRRDLSAILEGSGWAINARMRLTFRQANVFTCRPLLPGIPLDNDRQWRVWLLTGVIVVEAIFMIVYSATH